MTFPKQSDVEIPLLTVLDSLGGRASPKDVYPLVAKYFPDLSDEEQKVRMESSPNTIKWWNLVQWVRQSLVMKGELDRSTRGVWSITQAGRQRLAEQNVETTKTPPANPATLRDIANENLDSIRDRIVEELNNLSSGGFEKFCIVLLQQLGYDELNVTTRTRDGGIDGFGNFRQGVVSIKSAFQAKRWKDNAVSRPDIDRFRGAIQGDYDHGVFITTSRFTRDAEESSVKKGAITILLLDGYAVADLMIEKGIGVKKQPIYLMDLDEEFFDFD